MDDYRNYLANDIKQPYEKLSKNKFIKIFNFKVEKKIGSIGGITATNKKKETDHLKDVIKIFLEIDDKDIAVNKKFKTTNRRPDYLIDKYKLAFEYDGPDHYKSTFKMFSDKRKFKEYQNQGYRVIRWPYYMQLSKDAANYIFNNLIKHFNYELNILPKEGFYDDESKFEEAIGKVYKNIFTGLPAKSEHEVLGHGLHYSSEVAASMTTSGINYLLSDFTWISKKDESLRTPESIMNEFMYSHKLYMDDCRLKDEEKKELFLPLGHERFMKMYQETISKINIQNLKGLFTRDKFSIERTKPKNNIGF